MNLLETLKRGFASIMDGGATFCLDPHLPPLKFPEPEKRFWEIDAESQARYRAIIGTRETASHDEREKRRVASGRK